MSGTTVQIPREAIEKKLHEHEELLKMIEQLKSGSLCTIREMLDSLARCHDRDSNENTILQRLITAAQCEDETKLSSILQETPMSVPATPCDAHSEMGEFYQQVQSFQELARDGLLIKQNIDQMDAKLRGEPEDCDSSQHES